MSGRHFTLGCLVLGNGAGFAAMQADPGIAGVIGPVRQAFGVPAIGAAIVDSSGLRAMAVTGVRKRGETTEATADDLWHLGSDTKAMTATMIAALVEQGTLSWDSTIGGAFPRMLLPPEVRAITLLQLLTHRAGLPANAEWREISRAGTLVQQRRIAVGRLDAASLLSSPGTAFSYSNWGYVVAGAMAEQATGKSYEELMGEIVFGPLQMKSAGYGAAGMRGGLDQPWAHTAEGQLLQADNPLVMAPAGCVHCSLEDWGKFISDQLRGAEGKPALLKPESYARLHSPPPGCTYALGWGVARRPWGGGQVFTHTGSNTWNVAVVWMAPERDIAFLIACNQGGAEKACDAVATGLIALQEPGGAPR